MAACLANVGRGGLAAVRYADPNVLLARMINQYFVPPVRETVPQFAAKHRKLQNAGGGYVGTWSNELAPYLVGPMEALTDPLYLTVALVKPGQCGGTEIAQNWLHHTVEADPANMLWYLPTEALRDSFVKERVDTMLRLQPGMRSRLGGTRSDNAIDFKRFGDAVVQFLPATHSNLINKSAPRIVCDEVDATAPGLGNIKHVLDVRRQTFGRQSKLFMLSHCDRATGLQESGWNDGIMQVYADSTRCLLWWECCECGAWSSPNPTAARAMAIDYPVNGSLDEVEEQARLICPVNGCVIDEAGRRRMIATCKWVGAGQAIDVEGHISGALVRRDTAGFWIDGMASPFLLGGMGALARARVAAERKFERSGDAGDLRQVMVKQWGQPYAPPRGVDAIDVETLAARVEPKLSLGLVPAGVRFLVTSIDNQGNRFEILTLGLGYGGESWVVDMTRREADPAASADDWDALIGDCLAARYPLADGSGRTMGVRAVGFDAFGAPGVTEQAYAAWRRARIGRRTQKYGSIGGRDVWSLLPLRGMSTPNAPALQVVYPDTMRKDRKAAARGEIPLGQFNPNTAKDALFGRLKKADFGPGYVHFPADLAGDFGNPVERADAGHPWLAQILAESRKPNGQWEKKQPRNEALDLLCMAFTMARLLGLSRLNWDHPPAWADEWEANPMVAAIAPPPVVQPARPAPRVRIEAMPAAAMPPPRGLARPSIAHLLA